MPRILPFAGLRYAAPAGQLETLVSPPYDVISPDEQAELRALSPHNASYVELPADAAGRPGSRYAHAADRLATWRREGVLRPDSRPAYYLSETRFTHAGRTLRRRDLLAALGLEPWSSGVVLPHEHTMAGPKADRLELLQATHLNSSPIWVLHRQPIPELEQAWATAESSPPQLDFTWHAERRRLWVVDDSAALETIRTAFDRGGPVYIADGHHRYETSLAFQNEAGGRVAGANATLAAVTWAEDPGLLALPTHRLLRHVDPTVEEVKQRWATQLHAQTYPLPDDASAEDIDTLMNRLASVGRAAPSFGVYGLWDQANFGVWSLSDRRAAERALPADRSAAWKALDVSLLHALLIDPLRESMGMPAAEVLSYTRDPHIAVAAVRNGGASVAFFLNPTPVSGVLAVADSGDRMPEKSTYFHPKPPAGLVMRDLDAAE